MIADTNPPFLRTYKVIIHDHTSPLPPPPPPPPAKEAAVDLPLIDLRCLIFNPVACKAEIRRAAAEWGFFQVSERVVNHGVPLELLERLRMVQANLFRLPFAEKEKGRLLDFAAGCYKWGTPTATSLEQLSWSEAYHIPLASSPVPTKLKARRVIDEYSMRVAQLAYQLAGILAEGFEGGNFDKKNYIEENCRPSSCYLRLNRYPPCPIRGVYGLVPHTDSDFLTILHQDQVGGLQLMKGGRWITVNPNYNALIVNIGDLFQAWSNDAYKSVEHRVMANPHTERFSTAFQLCPSYGAIIKSPESPSIYRSFTFMEYKLQIQDDVKMFGRKVGLQRFLSSRSEIDTTEA